MLNDTSPASERIASHAFSNPASATASGYSARDFSSGGGDPFNPVRDEQTLWRSVIVQALMDAACGSKKYEAVQTKHDALVWLRGASADFATVCYYAGYEPEFVRLMIRKSLENGCRWRALPGEGTRVRHTRKSSKRKAGQRR